MDGGCDAWRVGSTGIIHTTGTAVPMVHRSVLVELDLASINTTAVVRRPPLRLNFKASSNPAHIET